MGFVTVNAKGLVVIPKSVRDEYGISPGDKLKIVYDREQRAILVRKIDDVRTLSEGIFGIWSNRAEGLRTRKKDERVKKLLKNELHQERSF